MSQLPRQRQRRLHIHAIGKATGEGAGPVHKAWRLVGAVPHVLVVLFSVAQVSGHAAASVAQVSGHAAACAH